MSAIFTNVGEFRRGKGNKKTRLGPRSSIASLGQPGGKQIQTPDDIAIKALGKKLDKPGLTVKDRKDYQDLVRRAEQLRFMNMSVLAEVLYFLHNNGGQVTEKNLNYNTISSYIDRLLPTRGALEKGTADEDLQIMRLRMVATFFRYIRYVELLREEANAEITAATAQFVEPGHEQ